MKRPSGPRPADTERTPTHTHRFPSAQEPPGRPLLSFPVFPLWSPEPQFPPPDHPDGAGSKTIGRKPITHTKLLLSRTSTRVACPRHTTHIRAFAFHSCYYDCPVLTDSLSCLRLFDYPFSESWCTEPWNPASDFLEFTLVRFDELTLIRKSRVRTPRTRTPETETRPAPKAGTG